MNNGLLQQMNFSHNTLRRLLSVPYSIQVELTAIDN